jgi:hypothetical protein
MTSLRFLAVAAVASLAAGCAPSPPAGQTDVAGVPQTFYGSVIETQGALEAQDVRKALSEKGRASLTFEGEVTATCAKKGCWMDVASGSDTVFVRFLDYSFFVPTDGAQGKRTVVQGEAFYDTLTVPMLKHYAEDAGKSQGEIDAITEPELRLAFTATGVMIEG